jgi:four helix bundle protein
MSKHHSLSSDLLKLSKQVVLNCYALSQNLPDEEKTNLFRYLRTAGLSVHINIAQAVVTKKKKVRKPHIREARKGLIVINAALDVVNEMSLAPVDEVQLLQQQAKTCYDLLEKLKKRQVMRIVAIDGKPAFHTERKLGL